MLRISSILAILVLQALSAPPPVQIKPTISLPFALRFGNLSTTLADHDRARFQAFKSAPQTGPVRRSAINSVISNPNIPATNGFVTYVAHVGVGSPPTDYSLVIDTGSSNTWVGAGDPYVITSTSRNTGDAVSVQYGSGSFSGTEFIDEVTLSPSLIINQQSIGVAKTSEGFQGVDGILGIGPTDLTEGTVENQPTVPTVTDNLFHQGSILSDSVGVSFNPTTSTDGAFQTNGELTFGTTDSTKFIGSITFVPITGVSPSNEFFGISQSITYGTAGTLIMASTVGIVDTGTTLLLIPSDSFSIYKNITGAVADRNTGLFRLTTAQFNNLQSLFFQIGPATFEFVANAQIWPRALNTLIGGIAGNAYLVVGSTGARAGAGFDFINGFVFLERFYSVFDESNFRVGLANTPHTKDTTN